MWTRMGEGDKEGGEKWEEYRADREVSTQVLRGEKKKSKERMPVGKIGDTREEFLILSE